MENMQFVREFLRHPKQLGTLVQSGKSLSRTMAREVAGCSEVVEFGAGTGPVTREILKCLPADGHLTSFEINSDLCRYLSEIGDARLDVVNDGAEKCKQYVEHPDCVVSELPLALFDKRAKEQILSFASRSGRYIQLQYTRTLDKEIRRYFSDVQVRFVPRNIPPAFVYVCRRADGDRPS